MRFTLWLIGLSTALCVNAATAQDYPNKPIRLIAPFGAGSTVDIIARTVAAPLSQQLGVPVVVENKPGAGGVIATDLVAKSPKDGYTLGLAANAPLVVNPSLMGQVPYDPVADFAPISEIAIGPNVLVVNPSVTKANTAQELIALAKAKPGALLYGSSGVGTANHMAGELFAMMAGISMVHVPYKGNAEVLTDVLGGRVNAFFSAIPPVMGQIQSGAVRALVVTGFKRDPSLPDVPTVAEVGLAGAEVAPWYGIMAPAGTPPAIIDRLHAELVKVMGQPAIRERFRQNGAEPMSTAPAEFAKLIRDDLTRWAGIIKRLNIKIP